MAATRRLGKSSRSPAILAIRLVAAAVAAILTIYALGALWLKHLFGFDWPKTLAVGVLPYLAGDGVKGALAVLVAGKLQPFLDGANFRAMPVTGGDR
jgi:biotin transporter BioY